MVTATPKAVTEKGITYTVGNNPINMWDPTGNVPEWVRSQSDYIVTDTRVDGYYTYDWNEEEEGGY